MDNSERSILVIDDENGIREMICDYLSEIEGYSVYSASNGADGLDILKNKKIDLVLSDINMPGMKGFDLFREIKELYPLVKRVLITAYNVEEYLDLALSHGIGNIFVKTSPFNFSELSITLKKLLEENIFGLNHYFSDNAECMCFKIRRSKKLEKDVCRITSFIGSRAQINKLELVLVELLTNAIFYGICNEQPAHKEYWEHNFVLPEDKAITVVAAKDDKKYGISITDTGGRLKKNDVLYWLNRQIATDQNGLPLGLYDSHGRGFFIARKYIDRLIINIYQSYKTEIIMINYYSDTYKGFKPLYINEL